VTGGRRRGHGIAAIIAAALTLAGLAALTGCTGEPPLISRVFAQPVFVRDLERNVTWARLGVFLVATDPDGQEDLSAFFVINDSAELFWKVESTAWVAATAEGESWIGSNTLAMPGTEPPPPGDYRVVLQDLGGETVEDTFTIAALGPPADAEWPSVVLDVDAIAVTGLQEVTQAWCYSPDGKLAATLPVPADAGRVAGLVAAVPGFGPGWSIWIYGYDRAKLRGLLVGPWRVR
jgi:hypothetical protein